MPRKTWAKCVNLIREMGASMRPRPDAAENEPNRPHGLCPGMELQ